MTGNFRNIWAIMRDCGSIKIVLKILQETVKSMNIPSE